MKKILAVVLIIGVVSLSAFGGGRANGKSGYRGGSYGDGIQKGYHKGGYRGGIYGIIKSLDLTDAQKTTLKEYKQAKRKAKKADREANRIQRKQDMYAVFANSSFDRDLLIKNAVSKATKKANSKADGLEKILSILTDAQKSKFYAKLEELKAK